MLIKAASKRAKKETYGHFVTARAHPDCEECESYSGSDAGAQVDGNEEEEDFDMV